MSRQFSYFLLILNRKPYVLGFPVSGPIYIRHWTTRPCLKTTSIAEILRKTTVSRPETLWITKLWPPMKRSSLWSLLKRKNWREKAKMHLAPGYRAPSSLSLQVSARLILYFGNSYSKSQFLQLSLLYYCFCWALWVSSTLEAYERLVQRPPEPWIWRLPSCSFLPPLFLTEYLEGLLTLEGLRYKKTTTVRGSCQ